MKEYIKPFSFIYKLYWIATKKKSLRNRNRIEHTTITLIAQLYLRGTHLADYFFNRSQFYNAI